MVRVKRRINRNFESYAVGLNFCRMKGHIYKLTDGSTYAWVNKRDALKLAEDIQRIFKTPKEET